MIKGVSNRICHYRPLQNPFALFMSNYIIRNLKEVKKHGRDGSYPKAQEYSPL